MGKNEAAAGILSDYLKLTEPGYALLFEAPWGAGKTHFIKSQMRIATDRSMRYVTLNGIDSAQAFRRALVVDNGDFIKIIGSAEKLANAAAKSVRLGDIGSLIRDAVEDRMIASLPETLVFDDLERCTLPVPVLIGLLNDFVEHRGKRVILIAQSDKHAEPSEFNSRKEKLVGRTVHLAADAEVALPRFIAQLNAGRGKDWLGRHQPLVLDVFQKDGQENLRLLRHGLQDCTRLLDVLEADLFAADHAIERLIRVFLALTLPFASGEITAEDLMTRNDYRLAIGPDEGQRPHPLYAIYKRHQNPDIFAGDASGILPLHLAVTLIGEGYASPPAINVALRMTGQFRIEEENPLWRRMLFWTDSPPRRSMG
ncbi:MAG: hypothetical protein IE922_11605 [Sphingomonadales bacterium]|nr:hypothetical protein [Sphingomonadales bacterium]